MKTLREHFRNWCAADNSCKYKGGNHKVIIFVIKIAGCAAEAFNFERKISIPILVAYRGFGWRTMNKALSKNSVTNT